MDDPDNVYAGLQDHESWKGPSNGPAAGSRSRTGQLSAYRTACTTRFDPTDSGWVFNSCQPGGQRRFDQRTGRATVIEPPRPPGAPALRYNWITPLVLSPHNPRILYTGA